MKVDFCHLSQCDIKSGLQCTNQNMKTAINAETDKTSIQVIERMVALLDALALYPDPVSLKELSSVTGLHPSTCLLYTSDAADE